MAVRTIAEELDPSEKNRRILGYSSRSTLYKVRKDGWLKSYEVSIDGRKYLDLHPRGHSPLDQHLKGILQWRPSNPIRKMNYMDA